MTDSAILYHLYGTDGCHLCEDAEQLCIQLLGSNNYKYVDIIDDETLLELFRISIPVLEKLSDGSTLYWPFDLPQLQEFICGTD